MYTGHDINRTKLIREIEKSCFFFASNRKSSFLCLQICSNIHLLEIRGYFATTLVKVMSKQFIKRRSSPL